MYGETGTSRKRKRLLTAMKKKNKDRMISAAKHRPHLLIQEIVQGMLTALKGGVAVWNWVSPSR
jgi:hypothetical protein